MEKPKGVSLEVWDLVGQPDTDGLTKQVLAHIEAGMRTALAEAEDAALLAALQGISKTPAPAVLGMDHWGLNFHAPAVAYKPKE